MLAVQEFMLLYNKSHKLLCLILFSKKYVQFDKFAKYLSHHADVEQDTVVLTQTVS